MSTPVLHLVDTLKGHSGAIYDVIRQGDSIYTASADKFVVRWNLNENIQGNFTVRLKHTAFNIALIDSTDQLVIGNSKGGLHCIDLKSKREERYLTQHKAPIFALRYDAVRDVLYSGDGDGYFCAWKADTMKLLITLPLGCGKIRQIQVSEDADHIAIAGQDGKLRILETSFFNEINQLSVNSSGVNCSIFLPNDQLLVGGKDAHLYLYNWRTEKRIKVLPAHNYAIYDLALIGEDQNYLVSVSFDKTIKLWSFPLLDIVHRIEFKDQGHRHTVNRIVVLNQRRIATVSDDAKIKIWELAEQ